jgi:hypothetical protein
MIDAVAKLRWCVTGNRDFAVTLTPEECEALLAAIPESDMVIRSLGAKDEKPVAGFNGEDDEHFDAAPI